MHRFYYCNNGFHIADSSDGAFWIDIIDPDASERDLLISKLNIPPMFLEYLSDDDERPRIERSDSIVMSIIRIPLPNSTPGMPYKTIPLGVISLPDRRVVTLCFHRNLLTEDFAEHTRRMKLCIDNAGNFTLRILYAAASWYLHYLKTLTEDVVGAEKDLEKSVKNNDLMWLMHMQKSLVFFNTSIKGNSMLLERIPKLYSNDIDNELLEDVEIELRQADSTVEIYSNILEGTMDSYSSIISNNVNSVMKRMTGLSIILMVPTFVASLYGMNVDILIGNLSYAFWLVIALSCVLTAVAFFCLRKIKWI